MDLEIVISVPKNDQVVDLGLDWTSGGDKWWT